LDRLLFQTPSENKGIDYPSQTTYDTQHHKPETLPDSAPKALRQQAAAGKKEKERREHLCVC
jgi:hypothetical protein